MKVKLRIQAIWLSEWPLKLLSMGLPSADNILHEQVVAVLAHVNFLLANLPKQLPTEDGPDSWYGTFLSFALDPEILEKTGDEVATLGEQLKSIFGWKAHMSGDGIIPILEQGKAICAYSTC